MNKIGFKNFRRFENFEPVNYRGITFIVGRNNVGKSTIVKALVFLDNYFKTSNCNILSFDNRNRNDLNILSYGRAINNITKDNFIVFIQYLNDFKIELTIHGETDNTFATVATVEITDIKNNYTFLFEPQIKSLKIIKTRATKLNNLNNDVIYELQRQFNDLQIQISKTELKKSSKEYIELVSNLEKIRAKLSEFKITHSILDKDYETEFTLEGGYGKIDTLEEIADHVITYIMKGYEKEYIRIQQGKKPSDKWEDLRALKEHNPFNVELSINNFLYYYKNLSIFYIGSNTSKQSSLFLIQDKNNPLAQAIHEFKQLNIAEGDKENRFLKSWMQKFEIGDNYKILMHAGEAYEMMIISSEMSLPLADKGMGSLQLMLLLLKLATVINKSNSSEKNDLINNLVIIEEPELNLHPALQSKLADLILEIHLEYKVDFLIETHSEYLIRRSQVLVAENEFEISPNENPFCVHYFPKDINELPYQLKYQEDGSFNRNFGDGFFDEASSSTLELLKLKRQKKA